MDVSSGSTFLPTLWLKVFCSVLLGGKRVRAQQAGAEPATTDTVDFGVSIPPQSRDPSELGAEQIVRAHTELERRVPTTKRAAVSAISLTQRSESCLCERIMLRSFWDQNVCCWPTLVCDKSHIPM